MKRLPKFGIRFLLLLIALVAISLSWLLHKQSQAVQENQAIEKITAAGGSVIFHHKRWHHESQVYKNDPTPGPWFIRKLFGENVFARVDSVSLRYIRGSFDIRQLEKLTQLKRIDIVHPDNVTGLDDLPRMPNLERLQLDGITTTDLRNYSPLKSLRYLYVYGCEQMTSLDGIQALTNVDDLWIGRNLALRDIQGIEKLTKLRRLHIGVTRVDDLSVLAELNLLEELSLGVTRFPTEPSVEVLSQLTNLEILKLANRDYPKGDLDGFLALTKMKHLEIGYCELDSVECFRNMRQLERLQIKVCPKLESLKGLEGLSNLKLLQIRGCSVGAEESQRIQRCLPQCKIVVGPWP